MPRKAKELTALAVGRLKEPGLHFVGGTPGLALQILDGGGRSWILRILVNGKRRDMGLGGFPEISLGAARDKARDARELVRNGGDPIEARKAARSAARAAQISMLTFRQAARQYVAAHEPSWKNPKHRAQWTSTLESYAYPVIGDLSVADVGIAHVTTILEPLWSTKTETASRLRGRIEAVLDWAKVRGYRAGENPARWKGHLDQLLPRRSKVSRTEHHRALPVDEIGSFMERLRSVEGIGAKALEFAILTAARSGEVRGATWSEVDLEANIWTVPAERMKAGRIHRVPLSAAAVRLLKNLPRMAGSDLIFSAPRGGQLSDMTLSAVCRRMEVAAVPHGFRSTFRDWVSERTAYPNEAAEMALAHLVSDKVEAAYRRGDLFDKRRRMAEDWARFASMQSPSSNKVVPLKARKNR